MTLIIDIACDCGDFKSSHGRFGCAGWCYQTCQEFRPQTMDRTSKQWESVLAEAERLDMPRFFTGDLFRDYQCLTSTDAPAAFVWGVRNTGTHLFWEIDGLARWLEAIARVNPDQRWYFWNGERLRAGDTTTVHRRLKDALANRRIRW
jgi:hypothetical protein